MQKVLANRAVTGDGFGEANPDANKNCRATKPMITDEFIVSTN
jgi:hypothetical protein